MSTKRDDLPVPSPPTVTPPLGAPPPFPAFPLPDFDARTHALRALGQWLSSLRYMRTMAPGQPPQEFAITPDRVFVEMPDNVERVDFPSIGILPGRGQYITRGIGGADVVEDTEGIAGPGTAMIVPYDYQELITVEGWGSKISERRSIVAAIETAIATYAGTTDLRLVLTEYFGLVATFSLMERENLDDLEVARGRRRVHLYVQLMVPVVRIGKFPNLIGPFVNVTVSDSTGAALVGGSGPFGLASLAARLKASSKLGGIAGLGVFGLTVVTARSIVRAALGLSGKSVV